MSSINKFKRFLFLTFSVLLFPFPAVAQSISGDGTLNTKVTSSDGKNFNIDGGTTAGGNLFHSFGRFSVPTNGSASFRNDTSIDNIIGRVTGNSVSIIDGLIKANGGANLFLINPAGILFKENARLDIGGSFLGSTADSLLFPDGGEFSATNTSGKPLLSVNAPIGLNFRDNPGKITNQSIADNSTDLFSGIKVQPGKNITLVGGNIDIDGGVLTAPEGQIRLGGIVKAGEVSIAETGNLTLPKGVTRSNVSLSNFATVNVSFDTDNPGNAGDINIQANNLQLSQGSFLDASTFDQGDAGTITVNANNSINLSGSSFFTNIEVDGKGEGGKIDITAKNLTLTDGSALNNSTFGQGDAGNINIKTSDRVSLNTSRIESRVGVSTGGKGGNINITAGDLSLTNGSTLEAFTSGIGDAGNVILDVDDATTLNQSSRIFSSVEPDAEGNGGKIDVQTNSLSLKEGSSFVAATFGNGNAGNVKVQASGGVSIDGIGTDGFASGIFSTVEENAQGNSGGINITAKNLFLSNGGVLNSSTFGIGNSGNIVLQIQDSLSLMSDSRIINTIESGAKGNGGNVNIKSGSIFLRDGSDINATSLGNGNAGKVTVTARDNILIDGGLDNDQVTFTSAIGNNVEDTGVGNAGGINITAKNLTLTNGGRLTSSTLTTNKGNAGNIIIKASDRVSLDESTIFSNVGAEAEGKGGNINITAGDLSLTNNSNLQAFTSGIGDAGSVILKIDKTIALDRSSNIFSTVESGAVGNGGKIDIQTTSLFLRRGSQLNTATFGQGNAGNVKVKADGDIFISRVDVDGFSSGIFSSVGTTGVGNAGGINITANNLSLRDQAILSSSTTGKGNAGSVVVKATGDVRLTNSAEIISDVGSKNFISEAKGKAGNINITAKNFFLNNQASLSSSTFENGNAGNIILKIDNNLTLDRSSNIFSTVESGAVGNGGKIDIQTNSLSLKEGSVVNATTFGRGDAGNINVKAKGDVLIDGGVDQNLSFTSAIGNNVEGQGVGNAGGINITTKNLTLTNGGRLTSSTLTTNKREQGNNAGNITIKTSDQVSLDSSTIFSTVGTDAEGKGGSINISAGDFSLTNGSRLRVETSGIGDAGSVVLKIDKTTALDRASIVSTVESSAVGNGGKIDIQTNSLSLKEGSALDATTFGNGNAGNINVIAKEDILIDGKGNNNIQFTSAIGSNVQGEKGVGNAGNIFITAKNLTLTNVGRIVSNTLGQGNAGSINVNVSDRLSLDESIILSIVGFDGQGKGGNINISAGDIFLTNLSNLRASTFSQGDAGKITVKAKGDIVLNERAEITSDVGSSGFATEAKGKAGTITIEAGNLFLNNQARLSSSTFEVGDAGNIFLKVEKATELNQSSRVFSSVASGAEGNGGKINVQTTLLSLKEGSSLSAATFGNGNAGNIAVKADGDIFIDGVGTDGFSSGIFSSVAETGIGNGGGVNITAKNLSLTNNSVISANTAGKGNAGNVIIKATDNIALDGINSAISSDVFGIEEVSGGEIKINTSNLGVTGGAAITASTFGVGDAGKIEIFASDTINLNGQGSDELASGIGSEVTQLASGNAGGIKVNTDNLFINNGAVINASTFGNGNAGTIEVIAKDKIAIDGDGSGIASSVDETGTGNAGGLSIEADSLTVSNSAEVTVDSEGKGQAGNLSIDADSLTLDRGNILASTPLGTGGNIDLQVDGVLSLDNESKISAQALGNANGGNIDIAAGFVVGFLNENSDIVAGAKEGQGGNISIDTRAIFGLEQRKSTPVNDTNDIDASSEFGLQGNISINSPDITPNQLGVELPENVMEPDEVVTQACSLRTGQNNNGNFTISGRGGIPQNGTQPLTNDSIQIEGSSETRQNNSSKIQLEDSKANSDAVVTKVETNKPISSDDIIPAQGWTVNEKGEVVLTRYPTVDGNRRNTSKSIGCN